MDTNTKDIFYDKLTYYYVQIPNFKKGENELSNHLEYWLYYLKNLKNTINIPTKLQNDELLKDAFDIAEFLNLDKDRQFAYQLDLKSRLDNQNVLDYAKKSGEIEGRMKGLVEGVEIGIKEGEKQAKLEIAKNLLDILDIETISLKTGLSIEELRELKK